MGFFKTRKATHWVIFFSSIAHGFLSFSHIFFLLSHGCCLCLTPLYYFYSLTLRIIYFLILLDLQWKYCLPLLPFPQILHSSCCNLLPQLYFKVGFFLIIIFGLFSSFLHQQCIFGWLFHLKQSTLGRSWCYWQFWVLAVVLDFLVPKNCFS